MHPSSKEQALAFINEYVMTYGAPQFKLDLADSFPRIYDQLFPGNVTKKNTGALLDAGAGGRKSTGVAHTSVDESGPSGDKGSAGGTGHPRQQPEGTTTP